MFLHIYEVATKKKIIIIKSHFFYTLLSDNVGAIIKQICKFVPCLYNDDVKNKLLCTQ